MGDFLSVLHREMVYIWYYFAVQFRQIFWCWVLGMAFGSLISVFAKDRIHGMFAGMQKKRWGVLGIIPACLYMPVAAEPYPFCRSGFGAG